MELKIDSNILIIAPKFHGYDVEIAKELKRRYKKVYLKNELPFNSSTLYFLLEKISPHLRNYMWNKYEDHVREIIINNNIDIVFIIRGELLPLTLIQFIKQENKELIYYQWDSVHNNPNSLVISEYADKSFSFDPEDCVTYPQFCYLPLFYTWSGLKIKKTPKYDLMFFGSWNYDRLAIVNEVKNICGELNLKLFAQLYMPFQSFIKRICQGHKFPLSILRFSSMKKEEYYNLMLSSEVIFDVPSKTQIGSTMRTSETLSLRKKLITTNIRVKNESFYHPDNILIWPATIDQICHFLTIPFNDTVLDNINSLPVWLDKIGFSNY